MLDQKGVEKNTLEYYDRYREYLHAYVRAVYANTQSILAKKGITEVVIYRGLQEKGIWDAVHTEIDALGVSNIASWTRETMGVANVRATMNPISSWSASMQVAYNFGGVSKVTGVLLSARVPAERIWSTAISGPGALNESEYVVLGGDTVTVAAAKADPKFVNSFLSEATIGESK